MKPDAECHRSFRCRQLFPKNKMHATSLPETSRTHVNTHKLDPHSPARLAIYGFLFGPIMIFDGHNFNLQGLRWTKGTPELAMLWPAVPCLACFSQFPPTATEHRLQVGRTLFVENATSGGGQSFVHRGPFCPQHPHAVVRSAACCSSR